ncbi:MAG: DNA topoisomerase VI subunit B [Candidatus Bilamarchaeaceae archaeon]
MAELFKDFKEHSVAEFFKKNRQMLGFSGPTRSFTIIVHELVTNSLDACEEAGILPEIEVEINQLEEDHFLIKTKDNGPGIPEKYIGKALGKMLAGTKFHRYIQQRGQQGIGASGCVMFSYLTTGKPIKAISCFDKVKKEYEISIDLKRNEPIVKKLNEEPTEEQGLTFIAEYKELKYEKSNKGPFEYLRRTALANPHATIKIKEPDGTLSVFPRSVTTNPPRPFEIKPHPLGIGTHDLLEFCQRYAKDYRKFSSMLQEVFARVSANKVAELRALLPDVDLDKNPALINWEEAEKIVNAFKKVKWIAPSMDALVPIGKTQIETSFKNIFSPEYLVVTERSPKVYRGGIPFMVEAAIAYGGGITAADKKGEIMRFANRVPLLFDASSCAITETVKSIDWSRYNLKNFEEEPIVVLVNFVSVYVPYSSTGKLAISGEDDINDEIKFAVMEAARGMQRYISGKRKTMELANKKRLVLRYVPQLSSDLAFLTGEKKEDIEKKLIEIIENKYSREETEAEEEKTEKKPQPSLEEEVDVNE